MIDILKSIVAVVFAVRAFAAPTPYPYLSMAPASYPRATVLSSGLVVATCEKPDPTTGAPRIVLLTRHNPESVWNVTAVVVEDATGVNPDLANGFPLQLPSGEILVAYRHHTGPSTARVYRIAVSKSKDGGSTWTPASVAWEGAVGVWEPFLYLPPSATSVTVRVVYSAEITNGGEQDIVQQESNDGGVTWGPRHLIVHTPGSRNGMPGVARLHDGSLVTVFEGFWTGVWGAFTVNLVRSFDYGVTWGQGVIVYAPARGSGYNAGSPQVYVCPSNGRIVVVYMTSVPQPARVAQSSTSSSVRHAQGRAPAPWPNDASIALVNSSLNAFNVSAPLNFSGSSVTYVDLVTPTGGFWPSFVWNDGTLGVVYQDEADNAAWNLGSFCT